MIFLHTLQKKRPRPILSEAEAHRYIEKKAMDTRRDRAEVAQEILDSYDPAQ